MVNWEHIARVRKEKIQNLMKERLSLIKELDQLKASNFLSTRVNPAFLHDCDGKPVAVIDPSQSDHVRVVAGAELLAKVHDTVKPIVEESRIDNDPCEPCEYKDGNRCEALQMYRFGANRLKPKTCGKFKPKSISHDKKFYLADEGDGPFGHWERWEPIEPGTPRSQCRYLCVKGLCKPNCPYWAPIQEAPIPKIDFDDFDDNLENG